MSKPKPSAASQAAAFPKARSALQGGVIALEPRTATDRSLAIIDYVLTCGTPPNARMISAELDLPKATVHRLLGSLEDKGLIVKDAVSGGYAAGAALCVMAYKILRQSAISGRRHAVLAGLAAETGETCNLGMLDGSEARYLDRVEPPHSPLKLDFRPGSRVPLYCSAMGKVFLSLMPTPAIEGYLDTVSLMAHTAATITGPSILRARLEDIRKSGFAVDDEEYIAGVNCLSVSVPSQCARSLIALAVQAPKSRKNLDELKAYLPVLQNAAQKIAHILDNEASQAKLGKMQNLKQEA